MKYLGFLVSLVYERNRLHNDKPNAEYSSIRLYTFGEFIIIFFTFGNYLIFNTTASRVFKQDFI